MTATLVADHDTPIEVSPGPGGGATIRRPEAIASIAFELPELAALMASLAALGPTASRSAESAMRKLTGVLRPHGGG